VTGALSSTARRSCHLVARHVRFVVPRERRYALDVRAGRIGTGPIAGLPPHDPEWREPDWVRDKHFVFVGGLHRSGTTLLSRLLRAHDATSAFKGTGAPQDEGSFLQDVLATGNERFGVTRMSSDQAMMLDERSGAATDAARRRVLACWLPHWDASKPVLLEKSPPNLLRGRLLQHWFPGASFVFIMRHPIAVVMAMRARRWHTAHELPAHLILAHWVRSHRAAVRDADALRSRFFVRYETLVARPDETSARLFGFLGLDAPASRPPIESGKNGPYLSAWDALMRSRAGRWHRGPRFDELESEIETLGYSMRAPMDGPSGAPEIWSAESGSVEMSEHPGLYSSL